LEKIVKRGGSHPVGAKLLLPERDEKKNIERPTSNVEWRNRRINLDFHYGYQNGLKETEIVNYKNCGAERHHYSMFDVGSSMFDVRPY
jgi:hypothetical protein